MREKPVATPAAQAPETDLGLLLFFTIDTEGSILRQRNPDPDRVVDELILGDYGTGLRGGIRLQMDLLERYGFRGCFFVDVLMEYQFGQEALERIIDAIATRGHEVQLHVHDEHLAWSDDPALQSLSRGLLRLDLDQFRRVMELSVDLFERRTGQSPLAYRAGGYRIKDSHFRVLEEFDIRFDSSIMAYSNSQVSDWMLTRTQPFRVGGVLEFPLTWLLLRDDRTAPSTRLFAPNATAGDPVSGMPRARSGPPRVTTYIAHSFDFMQADRDASPAAIDALARRIRANLAPEVADRHLSMLGKRMRIYDGTLDEAKVSSVEQILKRISERSDARCTTYGEFVRIADRFGHEERDEPVDPVPVLDRPTEVVTLTGTQIYTSALLSELSEPPGDEQTSIGNDAATLLRELNLDWAGCEVALVGPSEPDAGAALLESAARVVEMPEASGAASAFDLVVWPSGFEGCPPGKLSGQLESAVAMLKPDGLLVLHVRTLGVRPATPGVQLPPLAELLFSKRDLVAGAANGGSDPADVTAWDAATFSAWFAAQGLEPVRGRRIPRGATELAAIARFQDKLGALEPEELRTAAFEVALRRSPEGDRSGTVTPDMVPRDDPPRAVAELADRFAPILPEDAVLVICPAALHEADSLESQTASLDPEVLLRSAPEAEAFDFIIWTGIRDLAVERLEIAVDAVARSLRPGGFLLIRVPLAPARPPSPTTIVVSLLRAGLEVIETRPESGFLDCRLVRPLDFAEIARFAGVPEIGAKRPRST
jgi:hypothetical protein